MSRQQVTRWRPIVMAALADIWPTLPNGVHWIECQIEQESGGDPQAVSVVGARGLMQLMPGTAAEMGVRNVLVPDENVRGGVGYLKKQFDRLAEIPRYGDRLYWAFASYNGGRGYVNAALHLARDVEKLPGWWLWSVGSPLLADPRCMCQGHHPDHEQMRGYVASIRALYERSRPEVQ